MLGVVNGDGAAGFLSTPIIIDETFIKEASRQDDPEQHFRFSNECVEAGCRQWQSGKCGVINNIMEGNEEVELEPRLPDCSIRSSCRWFYQEGPKACSFCPSTITGLQRNRIVLKFFGLALCLRYGKSIISTGLSTRKSASTSYSNII
ncbi:MAG: hypothetical protein ABI813_00670 [Bacteroidota bacterium]